MTPDPSARLDRLPSRRLAEAVTLYRAHRRNPLLVKATVTVFEALGVEQAEASRLLAALAARVERIEEEEAARLAQVVIQRASRREGTP